MADLLLGSGLNCNEVWCKLRWRGTILNKLLDHFEGKLTSSKWAKMAKYAHDTALRDIQDLVNENVLAKDPAGGRSTNYVEGMMIIKVSMAIGFTVNIRHEGW
jgi:hypothetical protein